MVTVMVLVLVSVLGCCSFVSVDVFGVPGVDADAVVVPYIQTLYNALRRRSISQPST